MEPPDLSQGSFLGQLLIALDLIARLHIRPVLKAHTTLVTLSHLRDVLLDVLEGRKRAWHQIRTRSMTQGVHGVAYHRR